MKTFLKAICYLGIGIAVLGIMLGTVTAYQVAALFVPIALSWFYLREGDKKVYTWAVVLSSLMLLLNVMENSPVDVVFFVLLVVGLLGNGK